MTYKLWKGKESHVCLNLFITFFCIYIYVYISLADANSSFKCNSQDLVKDSSCILKSTLVFNAKRALAYFSTYFHLWIFHSRHVAPVIICNVKEPNALKCETMVILSLCTLTIIILWQKFFGYHLITCDSFILPKGKKIKIKIQPNRMKVAFKTRVKV